MANPSAVESRSFHAGRGRGHVTMRLEYVDCGKCPRLHGPYWYAYQDHQGRTLKVYVGKDYDEAKAARRIRQKID